MPILFLHVPKTAGSFIDSQMKNSVLETRHAASNETSLKEGLDSNAEYIGGHFLMDHAVKYLNPKNKLVSLVRNPVDRLFSEANYHIEILLRGKDFFNKHNPAAKKIILKTLNAVESRTSGNVDASSISHLYDFGLDEYIAKRIITKNDFAALSGLTPLDCYTRSVSMIKRFSLIEAVENNGVKKMIDFISQNSEATVSNHADSGFNNNSNDWLAPFNYISQISQRLRSHCSISNLLHLSILGYEHSFFKGKCWSAVNEIACAKFIHESKYIMNFKEAACWEGIDWVKSI